MINFKQLKQVLDQGKKEPEDPNKPKKLKDMSPIERLFHETRMRIYQENYNIGIEPKYPLSCDPERARLFTARHYGLLSMCQEMQANFQKLEKEYDTLELRQHLAYTEQYMGYIRAMSVACQELVEFKIALEENQEYVANLGKQLLSAHDEEAVQALEPYFEQVLDTADLFKDRYEDFPQRNIDRESLTPFYEEYQKQVELLQSDFEEAKDWVD